MSDVTDRTLDTVKAHIEAIVDGSIVITVHNGQITLIDSIHHQADHPKQVNA